METVKKYFFGAVMAAIIMAGLPLFADEGDLEKAAIQETPAPAADLIGSEDPLAESAGTMAEEIPSGEVNAEALVKETAEALTPAGEAGKEEKAPESVLNQYPPQVKLSQWGPEIRINVIPDPQMGAEGVLAVQSVKLETEKGEYLGLKTFQPEEKTREAEFMINPEILKLDAVKITVSSKTDGEWIRVQPLKSEEGVSPEAGKPDAAPAAAPVVKPRKKGWWG